MYAVVEIAGTQFEVEQNDILRVPLLDGQPGDSVEFGTVLMTGGDDGLNVGTPFVEGSVKAKIIEHGKDDKILVFHKKRRKGYRKLNGHRQRYTKIEITNLNI